MPFHSLFAFGGVRSKVVAVESFNGLLLKPATSATVEGATIPAQKVQLNDTRGDLDLMQGGDFIATRSDSGFSFGSTIPESPALDCTP